jgi:hypothetical protein
MLNRCPRHGIRCFVGNKPDVERILLLLHERHDALSWYTAGGRIWIGIVVFLPTPPAGDGVDVKPVSVLFFAPSEPKIETRYRSCGRVLHGENRSRVIARAHCADAKDAVALRPPERGDQFESLALTLFVVSRDTLRGTRINVLNSEKIPYEHRACQR